MQITFGDDAIDAYIATAATIPSGYTVALLDDGEDLVGGPDPKPGVDVHFLDAVTEGVRYRDLTNDYEPTGPVHTRPWTRVARVHVY